MLSDLNAGRGVMSQVGLRAVGPLTAEDGVLTSDASFEVTLVAKPGGDVPGVTTVTVSAADTDFNETRADLLRDINDALEAAGLGDLVEAILGDGQLLTFIATNNDVASIRV